MTEHPPAYIVHLQPDAGNIHDWLKAQLAQGLETVQPGLIDLFGAIPWRQRTVVCLLYAEHMTQERVGWLLGISRWTVMRDVDEACVSLRQAMS